MSLFGAEAIFGDLVSDGIAGLQSAVTQYGGGNITNPGGAIAALQAAGAAAVKVVGPAIDTLSGGDPQTSRVTQGVWQQNGILAGINNGDSATQSDLTGAVGIVRGMASQYTVGARLAASLKASPAAQAAARAAGQPKAAKTAVVRSASASAAAAPAPTAIPSDHAPVLIQNDLQRIAPVAGGVLGLILGGTVGFRLGAQVGLILGGPIGGVIGAGIGYLITKPQFTPAPTT